MNKRCAYLVVLVFSRILSHAGASPPSPPSEPEEIPVLTADTDTLLVAAISKFGNSRAGRIGGYRQYLVEIYGKNEPISIAECFTPRTADVQSSFHLHEEARASLKKLTDAFGLAPDDLFYAKWERLKKRTEHRGNAPFFERASRRSRQSLLDHGTAGKNAKRKAINADDDA